MIHIKKKKAMSQFEVIGYAILAIVVIIVAIVIFTKLTKGPSDTIGTFTGNQNQNTNDCIKNPATCDPLKQNTAAPTTKTTSTPSS